MFNFHFKFPSLTKQEYGYTFNHADNWYRGGFAGLSHRAGIFWHGGDGLTLHSGFSPVVPDDFCDYLNSLAVFLLEGDNFEKYAQFVENGFYFSKINTAMMDFVFKPEAPPQARGKELYYSLGELKKSSDRRKADLKSWTRLPYDHKKGIAGECFSILCAKNSISGALDSVHLYQEMLDHAGRSDHWLPDRKSAHEFFRIPQKDINGVERAYRAVRLLVESWRKKDAALRMVNKIKETLAEAAA